MQDERDETRDNFEKLEGDLHKAKRDLMIHFVESISGSKIEEFQKKLLLEMVETKQIIIAGEEIHSDREAKLLAELEKQFKMYEEKPIKDKRSDMKQFIDKRYKKRGR